MSENFYEEKLKEIRELIAKGDFKQAHLLLAEEVKMPYIPAIYEKQFHELFAEVVRNLMSDEGRKQVPVEELIEMLFADDTTQLMAIEILKDTNIRPIKEEIKKRIETYADKDALKRTFLFELLSEQEISIKVTINGIEVNPTQYSIAKDKEVQEAIISLPYVVAKQPQMYEPVFNELQRYLLLTFPKRIENGKMLVEQIYNIVLSMFDSNISLTQTEKEIFDILNRG